MFFSKRPARDIRRPARYVDYETQFVNTQSVRCIKREFAKEKGSGECSQNVNKAAEPNVNIKYVKRFHRIVTEPHEYSYEARVAQSRLARHLI